MKTLTNVLNQISRCVAWLAMTGLAVMMFLTTIGVITRLIFGQPLRGAYEIVEMIMAIVVFGSYSYTQTKHGHVHVTMIIAHLPNKIRFLFFAFTSLLSTGVIACTTMAMFQQAAKNAATGLTTGIVYLPQAPVYYASGVALLLFTLVLLLDAVKAVLAIFSKTYAEEIMASWV
jgi:TRAP-type C4-dicarboxylate transport system permease small subunit